MNELLELFKDPKYRGIALAIQKVRLTLDIWEWYDQGLLTEQERKRMSADIDRLAWEKLDKAFMRDKMSLVREEVL